MPVQLSETQGPLLLSPRESHFSVAFWATPRWKKVARACSSCFPPQAQPLSGLHGPRPRMGTGGGKDCSQLAWKPEGHTWLLWFSPDALEPRLEAGFPNLDSGPIQSPPRLSPPTGLSFPVPSGLSSAFGLCFCVSSLCPPCAASPPSLPTLALANTGEPLDLHLDFRGSAGTQAAPGPQDPPSSLKTARPESVVREGTHAETRPPRFIPRLYLLRAV